MPSTIMPSPRAFSRLLTGALAVFIVWQARGASPQTGIVLLVAAAVLFVHSVGEIQPTRASGAPIDAPPTRLLTPSSRRAFFAVWALSALLCLTSLLAFFLTYDGLGWILHLGSIAALLVTAIAFERRRPADREPAARGSRREWALLALVLVLALVPRVWQNDRIPEGVWYDEARVGVVARQMLTDPTYRPVYIPYVERPAHHTYLVALSVAIFGATAGALRDVTAAFSLLNMLAAFILFRRWFARVTCGALLAVALLATMRYDLTLARILFDANTTPFFILMTLFFLDRGLADRRLADFTLAGLTLGIGLAFYLPMRLFVVLLVALAVLWCAVAARRARSLQPVRAFAPHAFCLVFAALIAFAPVLQFALLKPQVFFDRTASASTFTDREEADLLVAVWNSAVKHAGMFNVRGDMNGRHNLPGEPMLDPLTGVLFLLGIALALARWRERTNFIMLALLIGMMQAGIFATDWEAPHALRAIGALPSIVYFSALGLVSVLTLLRNAFGSQRWLAPALVVFLALVAWLNLDTYFNRQANDPVAWAAHSIGETWTAREMMSLAPSHDIIVTARYAQSPTIQFLAPGISPVRLWSKDDHLPLPPLTRPVVLFLDDTLAATLDEARRYYPDAEIHALTPPNGGLPVTYEIILKSGSP